MQGVQGTGRVDGRGQAAYEEYSILGRCPECREGLVYAGEERTELTCSFCGIVVSRADYTREDGSIGAIREQERAPRLVHSRGHRERPVSEGCRLRVGEADAEHRRARRTDADVLDAARDANTAGDGVGITTLLRKGNVSYSRLAILVSDLIGSGLLIEVNKNSGGAEAYSRYKNRAKRVSGSCTVTRNSTTSLNPSDCGCDSIAAVSLF